MTEDEYFDEHIPHRINLLTTFRERYFTKPKLKPNDIRDFFRCSKDISILMVRFFLDELGIIFKRKKYNPSDDISEQWKSKFGIRQLTKQEVKIDPRYPNIKIVLKVANRAIAHIEQSDVNHPIKLDTDHYILVDAINFTEEKIIDGIKQLKVYCNDEGSPIGVWSNGGTKIFLHREEPNIFVEIDEIPTVDQSLESVINNPWTIDKLKIENKLVKEKLSLKSVILDLENLVLANAKGIDDSFDEVFKLIYAKLYDEWAATNDPVRKRKIQFRIYGESPDQLKEKITGLLRAAAKKWKGVFIEKEEIKLTANHLKVCVSFLQGIRLFNANLQVIDDAFEYLVTEIAKGKKGQYFTPRWVIDMCVKMMNPKITEKIVDPACGSAGFTVHSIFWVAGEQFTAEGLPQDIKDYAGENVYGIDSSPRAVKISKAINLIAGDGKTNIYELNSLESDKWDETGKAGFKDMLTEFDDPKQNDENKELYKFLDFDVLLTNPPFAGPINEKSILKHFLLAEKNGKTQSKVGRDILFIERCLNMMKNGSGIEGNKKYEPVGRCAIVLPQGRLNNSSDLNIRNFIFEKARLLAVVGLNVNTFKPHTGTKTSVIFLQKYTSEEVKQIQNITAKHENEWDTYFEKEVKSLLDNKKLSEDGFPELLKTELQIAFEVSEPSGEEKENDEEEEQEEITEEDLKDSIADLEEELAEKPKSFKGKAGYLRNLADKKKKLASFHLKTQLKWFVEDVKSVETYRKNWLAQKAAEDLNYPIFFAVE